MNFLFNIFGGSKKIENKINFEDVQIALKDKSKYILINTLDKSEQKCLIKGTINVDDEEKIINECINKNKYNIFIIIYGKNSNCMEIIKKYNQLKNIGFKYIYVYVGGLFEWLLLQDIYGNEIFPTNNTPLNGSLKFKPLTNNPIIN